MNLLGGQPRQAQQKLVRQRVARRVGSQGRLLQGTLRLLRRALQTVGATRQGAQRQDRGQRPQARETAGVQPRARSPIWAATGTGAQVRPLLRTSAICDVTHHTLYLWAAPVAARPCIRSPADTRLPSGGEARCLPGYCHSLLLSA